MGMKPDWFWVAPGFAWGLLLGGLYFWGLWITVKHIVRSRKPGKTWIVSFLARTSFALFGFYLALHLDIQAFFSSLIGFFAARFLANRISKPSCEV
ncbi:ATP synthase subunit I [Thermodesulfobacteriota bacterium]